MTAASGQAPGAPDAVLEPARIPEVQARLRPHAPAMDVEGRITTYGELDARSAALARALAGRLGPGERIAALLPNRELVFELLFAAARARACFVPINRRLAPAEIGKLLDDAGPGLLFVDPSLEGLAREALAVTSARPAVIVSDEAGLRAFLEGASGPTRLAEPRPEDDLILLYTSGTTGLPKGVRHTHATYEAMLRLSLAVPGFAYGADDIVLDVMPLCHVAGLNSGLMTFSGGGRLVILPEFSPGAALAAIGAKRVTKTLLAPVMMRMMLDAPEIEAADLSSLALVCYGASPISPALLARARARLGCGLMQLYGMTELAGPATVLPPEAHDAPGRLASCGRPWPGLEVKVVNAAGRSLGRGAVGQVLVRGPNLTAGYLNQPEATAETLRNGWLHTGDAGYFDEAGDLFIQDRIKDMIVSGGENIYPAEVECVLAGCPGVADAAVIGAPSDEWGEAVVALLVPSPGAQLRADDVRAWLRGRIAGYKIPKEIDLVAAIPRNGSGKILRRELRAPYWAQAARQVG